MKTFGSRLRAARKEKKLTQSALAKLIDRRLTHVSVSGWENDKYLPDSVNSRALEKVLGVSCSELMNGKSVGLQHNIDPNIDNSGMYYYPIINWTDVNKWSDTMDGNDWKGELYKTSRKSDGCFALEVNSDNMLPEFKQGERILVDPNVKPKNNYFVVVSFNGSAVLKLLIVDSGKMFVKSINPDWPSKLEELSSDHKILGCVVEKWREYI